MPDTVSIAGYELLERIGSGASGTVYKARQISMDRLVAIKILPSELAQDKRFIERFTREARAVAKLNHSNVVTGIDVGEAGGCWYFVMEYVDGESAAVRVQRDEAISEKEALEIVRQIALALDHAYKNGIIHRDIKPANILMTRTGLAKLADLGVARHEGEGGAGGRVFGTPYYMSPEQARGGGDVDIRSDIYSLGATLYHLLAGKPPFHGHPPAVVMAKQIAEEPEDPRRLNPKVSRTAAALVASMMAKDRDDRPETPMDLEEEIRRVQKGRMPSKVKVPPRAPPHAAARPRRHAEAAPQAAPGKGGLVAAAVVGVAILLGAAAWLFLGSGRKDGTDPVRDPTVPDSSPNGTVAPVRPSGGPPDAETVARDALNRLLKQKLAPEKELEELRKFIGEHDDAPAAVRDAVSRVERLEAEMKGKEAAAAMQAKVAELRDRAAPFVEKRQFGKALDVFRKVEAEGTLRALISQEIERLHEAAEAAILKAASVAMRLCGEGAFRKAREEIAGINVDGMDDLGQELKGLLARVDELEKAQTQASDARKLAEAEAVYSALSIRVNAALATFKPDDASRLLLAARGNPTLAPLVGFVGEDEEHVGYFREVVVAAARTAEDLRGNARTFRMRDGTEQQGTIQGADRNGVTIQQRLRGAGRSTVTVTLAFPNLSDAEIVSLALPALDEKKPMTRLKTAVLYAVGGDVDAARKELESARKLGADTSSVERRWILSAEEARAAELLAEARRLYAAMKAASGAAETEARQELARVLGELKGYSHTKVYKANFSRKPAAPEAPPEPAPRPAPRGDE